MDIFIISIVAFGVAILTFFSGFGLGTILTPVFMVFFPVELAIALTGIVHFFNNLFKIILVGKDANKEVVLKFGLPAIVAAFFGAWVLLKIPDNNPLFTYDLMGHHFEVYPVKFIISILLIGFASMDLIPYFKNLSFDKSKLPIGGILSGFFGGLSGNQGALRTAFLIRAGLSKEAFIGSAVVISTLVDFSRLSMYATKISGSGITDNIQLILCATGSAIAGAVIGHRLLKKITLHTLQVVVAIMLIVLSIALGLGWV